jgi:tryptophan-rich sensory protein
MELSQAVSLAVFVLAAFAAASTGAIFQPGPWYAQLRKPAWTPPNLAFPIVWSVLYVLIAIAGWRIWEARGPAAAAELALWTISLALNAAWSWIFFGRRQIGWALVEVSLLWASIAAMIAAFAPIDGEAAWMLAPYLVWVTIAAALNYSVWRLNRPAASPV